MWFCPDKTIRLLPSGHTTLKWRRINVDATWSRRIDVGTTSFWCCVPAGYSFQEHCVRLLYITLLHFTNTRIPLCFRYFSESCFFVWYFTHKIFKRLLDLMQTFCRCYLCTISSIMFISFKNKSTVFFLSPNVSRRGLLKWDRPSVRLSVGPSVRDTVR